MNNTRNIVKRIFDLCGSMVGIVLFVGPFCFIAIAIALSSPGPIFFRQVRIGRNIKPFICIKFRTMVMNAEGSGTITTLTDLRVTPLGRCLRNFKLDELPQLWNVLVGKMSFVGPRPDVPGYADKLEGEARKILELRPGITGPASLYFRNEEQLLAAVPDPRTYNDRVIWPKKVQLNRVYYDQWSFWKDIGYILVTLFPGLDKFFKLIPKSDA